MTLVMRQVIIDILNTLDFDNYLQKKSSYTKITSESFDKLSQLEFRLIFYFLFYKLNRELCQKRFRNVFPSRDIQQETEFRKIAFDWINELNQKKQKWDDFGTILPISFQRLSGVPFVKLLFKFSNYVMYKNVSKVNLPVELKTKLTLSTREELDAIFNEYYIKLNHYEEELTKYDSKITRHLDEQNRKYVKLFEKSYCLEKYGNIELIEHVNAKFCRELQSLVKYLLSFMLSIRNSNNLMIMINQNHVNCSNEKLNVNTFALSLTQKLKELECLQKIMENDLDEWISALKNSHQMKRTTERITELLKQSSENITLLEMRLAELHSSILNCELAKRYHQIILNYLRPLTELNLTI